LRRGVRLSPARPGERTTTSVSCPAGVLVKCSSAVRLALGISRDGLGLSLGGSAAQHPGRTLCHMPPRRAGDVGAWIDVRIMRAVRDRPPVSQVPAAAGQRVCRAPFERQRASEGRALL
jgi:hypothetical protein